MILTDNRIGGYPARSCWKSLQGIDTLLTVKRHWWISIPIVPQKNIFLITLILFTTKHPPWITLPKMACLLNQVWYPIKEAKQATKSPHVRANCTGNQVERTVTAANNICPRAPQTAPRCESVRFWIIFAVCGAVRGSKDYFCSLRFN